MTPGLRTAAIVASLALTVAGYFLYTHGRALWVPAIQTMTGKQSVNDVLVDIGPAARARLSADFQAAGIAYPPPTITLLAIKDTARLELWAGTETDPVHIRDYNIQALSGNPGPKLREGDRQVPEGIYRIEGLNPNSSYHLSLKLDYPNAFDRQHAAEEGREEPGSNIFIHGKAVSIGCLAMGDQAIEELFVLAADTGKEDIKVVIAPSDPRRQALSFNGPQPWGDGLYRQIEMAFQPYVDDGAFTEVSRAATEASNL